MPKLTQCPIRQIPNLKSVATLETLANLIYYKEQAFIKSMGKLMQKLMMEQGKPFFDVWMYEVSDEIQIMAQAFGERFMLEEAITAMNKMTNAKAKELTEKAIFLHAVTRVRKDLGWYTMNGCISHEAGQELNSVWEKAVKDFLPHMNTTLASMSIIQHKHVQPPIVRDYIAFNAQPDNENYDAAGEIFDFRKTGQPRARL